MPLGAVRAIVEAALAASTAPNAQCRKRAKVDAATERRIETKFWLFDQVIAQSKQ